MTTLAGKLPQEKYETLGFTGTPMIHPLEHLFGLIVGKPKDGKSNLVQSNPDALVYNLDISSTTTDKPDATIWPGITKDGQPMDVNRQPMVVTWEAVNEKINLLCQMVKDGKECPKTVYFDSLSAWINLLKDYLVREQNARVTDREITRWQDMDGRRMWDILYDIIIETCMKLRRHGRGVWLICHVIVVKTPVGRDGNAFEWRPELNITDGFYRRLYPMFEMVGCVEKRVETEQETIEQEEVTLKSGKKHKPRPKTLSHKKPVHYFTTDNRELKNIVGQRVKMDGEIVLPPIHGWAQVSEAYKRAARL